MACRHEGWYSLGYSHSIPSSNGQRDAGMRDGTVWNVLTTLGWDGQWDVGVVVVQFEMFPLHSFLPLVHWDGMDSPMQA